MELFKKEFYEDLSKITNHWTVSNAAVNISGEAFKAMKDDHNTGRKFFPDPRVEAIPMHRGTVLC